MSTTSEAKVKVEKELSSIIRFCSQMVNELADTPFKHPKLKELQSKYLCQLKEMNQEFLCHSQLVKNEIVWDHLVVAFFGETNAGKSTLVEMLRLNYGKENLDDWKHGEIVGNGQADFTKDANEYELNIKGKRITLIDVPGIEGEEVKFASTIKKAISKAHLVFYVQGKNKKPDSEIAKKITHYLSDWSRVYSIYNVRCSIDEYEYGLSSTDTLLTDEIVGIKSQINDVFNNILKNTYQGNMALQGLIGLAASSEFHDNKEWAERHRQVLGLFKDSDSALKFANIPEFINLLSEVSEDYASIILKSNLQKIDGLKRKGLQSLKEIEKSQQQEIELLKSRLQTLKNNVSKLYNNTITNIRRKPVIEANVILGKLKKDLIEIIKKDDNTDRKKSLARSKQASATCQIEIKIKDIIDNEIDNLRKKFSQLFKEFKQIKLYVPRVPDIKIDQLDVNLNNAFEELEISLTDVLSTFKSIGGTVVVGMTIGSAIPGIGTMVGAVMGAVMGAVGGGIMKKVNSDGGKGKASEAIDKEIEICKDTLSMDIQEISNKCISKLKNCQMNADRIIDKERSSVDDFLDSLNDIYIKLTPKGINSIKNER